MLKVLFTLDYEIHGNGDGSPLALMVEPTRRMMDLFDRYGAKLTIMADVAEILRFKEYQEQVGSDDFAYQAIAEQLREAVRRGHDVQLHLHASYFNATCRNGRWEQDWSEYNFAGLSPERLNEVIRLGRQYLEGLLRPVKPAYECFVFRAANWAVSPSRNVVRALHANGIRIDTSVFKFGRRDGIVQFDYEHAPSALLPWLADEEDICRSNPQGQLVEVPIYCERRWIGAFLSANRVYRAIVGRAHRIQNLPQTVPAQAGRSPRSSGKMRKRLSLLTGRHAWKADFNQCTGRQLVRALLRAKGRYDSRDASLPFVLIGHSKLFNRANERSLEPFLKFVANHDADFGFADFGGIDVPQVNPALVKNRHRDLETTRNGPAVAAGKSVVGV